MPNFLSGTIMPLAPTSIAVGISSTQLVAFNSIRAGLTVINSSTGTIYLGLGNIAVLNAGIALNPSGGTWVMDEYTYTNGQINAIAHAAATSVAVQEFNTL